MGRLLHAFELGPAIGAGGMGQVFAATHRPSGARVAIKVLSVGHDGQGRFREALDLELRAVALLDHPGIVRLLDFGRVPGGVQGLAEGSPFLVLEHVDGGSLQRTDGSWEGTRAVLLGVLDALAHAHARGLIHRDLKPANLLMRGGAPVLADFGLATLMGDHRVLEQAAGAWPGMRVRGGTPNYIAPEQVRGALREQGPWTDLYALGCLAYTLVTGAPPFADEEIPDEILRAHLEREPPPLGAELRVPGPLADWLLGLLQKDPRHRPQAAADA